MDGHRNVDFQVGRAEPPAYGTHGALTATALIFGLITSAGLAIWVARPLYADGANYLLHLLTDPELFSSAWTRRGVHLITQMPVLMAMRAGVSDVTWLARIYAAALSLPPLLAYATTTWVSRRDPLLFIGNAVIVIACFYPVSIFMVGEFQILYALFWCGFVLLMTGKADRPVCGVIVLWLAIAIAASYEISVLLCPLLILAGLWRINRTDSRLARHILILTMVLLAAGTVIGALGILLPRDPVNSAQFLQALLQFHYNATLLGLTGLVVLAGLATLLGKPSRRCAAVLIAVACVGFGWHLTRLIDGPALGDSYRQRAQIVPILLAVVTICGFDAWWRPRPAIWRRRPLSSWPLLLPALMVVALDMHTSLGWRGFLGRFCTTLTDEGPAPSSFYNEAAAKRYGWDWTYTVLSVLLRPADSTAMVRNPEREVWQPFDPDGVAPNIDRYKTRGGMCRLVRPGF